MFIDGGSSGLTYTATADAVINVGASGTLGNKIVIATGATSPSPSGHDGIVTIDGAGAYRDLIKVNGRSYITINGEKNGTRNLKLYNSLRAGNNYTAFYSYNSTGLLVTYLEIEKCATGLFHSAGSNGNFGGEFSYLYVHDVSYEAGISFTGLNGAQTSYDLTTVHNSTIKVNSAMDTSGAGPDGVQGCPGLTVHDCIFDHIAGTLLEVRQHSDYIQTGAHYIKVYNNTFYNITDSAVDQDGGGDTGFLYVYNNLFVTNTNMPMSQDAGPTGIRNYSGSITSINDIFIYGNTFVDVVGAKMVELAGGATAFTVNNVHIRNNIFYNCARTTPSPNRLIDTGISSLATQSDYDIDYNLINAGPHGGSVVYVDGDPFTQSHPFTGTPTFVSYTERAISNNLHLSTGDTSAKDNGSALSSPFDIDKDGVSRPQGSGWDIGAFEFNGTGSKIIIHNHSAVA